MGLIKRILARFRKRPQISLLALLILVAVSALLIRFVAIPAYERSARRNILAQIIKLDGKWVDLNKEPLQRRLLLKGERVDDDFIFDLAYVIHLVPELTQLDLMKTKVSGKSWERLLKRRSSINHYVLYKNDISEAAVNKARKLFPNLQIEQRKPDPTASGMVGAPVPTAAIVSLVRDQHSQQILTGAGDGRVHRIGLQNNQRSSFQMHGDWAFSIAISPSRKWVATGGGDNKLSIHRWDDLATIVSQDGHTQDIHGAVWMDDTSLVTASDDKTLRQWKFDHSEKQSARLTLVQTTHAHDKSIPRLVKVDDDTVLTASRDHTLKQWRLDDGKFQLLKTFVGHKDDCMDASVNQQATQLASVGYDGQLILWDMQTGNVIRRHQLATDWLFALWVDWSARRAVVGGKACLQCVDLDTGQILSRSSDQTFVSRIIPCNDSLITSDAHGTLLQRDRITLAPYRRAQVFERGFDDLSTEGFQWKEGRDDSFKRRDEDGLARLSYR